MSTTTRNILIACGVLAIVAVACVCFVLFGGLSVFLTSQRAGSGVISTVISSPIVEQFPADPTAFEEAGTPESSPDSEAGPDATQVVISGDLAEDMDRIQQQVVELRGLQPVREVERSLLTPVELREKVVNDFLEDYTEEEASDDTLILAAFDLLEPDFDLMDFYIELFTEQIAGFYDDESEEMYVVRGGDFGAPERLTYAHEYGHVLQDQNYDIENGLNYTDEVCETDSERCAAIQALLEGDASLVELLWFSTHAGEEDQREILEFYNQFESPIYDSAPDFMKQDFLFPYQAGQEFVQYLYESGGWEAINRAYEDPPITTEQILHPEQYPDDQPINVSLPDISGVLGQGWRELDQGVMGEWSTYLILGYGLDKNARLSDEDAKSAAQGWGGDAYVVYHDDEGGTVTVLKTAWDTVQDANEFREHFQDYAGDRFGNPIISQEETFAWETSEIYSLLQVEGAETTWISAPNADTANAIWEMLSQNP